MQNKKDFFESHALTFCAAISLLALFLPFAYMKIESSYIGDVGESISLISFIFGGGWIGAALFLFPIVLIVFNYVTQEQPPYEKEYILLTDEVVTEKVFVIDDETHHTFLLAEEY